MDKDRVIGSAKVVKGKLKAAVGKALGDAKLDRWRNQGRDPRCVGSALHCVRVEGRFRGPDGIAAWPPAARGLP